ncbi:hypothetical protein F5Y12DRAFT_664998 [Xylaria sp. FL1777]|nr:hypothetical protein F5Y12DRAFT_664998 [Xylaria sp. FL1777]
MSSKPGYYGVYMLKFTILFEDPDMPQPRYHHVIFVETEADGSGIKFEVTGDITSGMTYESKPYHNPRHSNTQYTSHFLGYTPCGTVPDQWDALLSQLPPPAKQKAFNIKTMKTEPFKSAEPLTFYQPGEARRPLRKCTEWTEEQALPALYENRYIQA